MPSLLQGAITRYFFVCMVLAGCNSLGGGDSDGSKPSGKSGDGICRSNCPKSCSDDNECDTAKGQMCCDFGGGATACTEPQACPRFCAEDSECNSEKGEACCVVSLATDSKVCTKPQSCVHFCAKNADCSEDEVCCTSFVQPICVAPEKCPVACGASADCMTEEGQVCCKNLDSDLAALLSVSGVCYAKGMQCSKACSSSNQCDTGSGEICCSGFCSKSCQKNCKENQDCDMGSGQLCCQNPAVQSIWMGGGGFDFSYADSGDDCCKNSNPCNWDNDGTCDCDGYYEWDYEDCQGRYYDDAGSW